MPRIVGIDLGTSNSLVAHLDGERPSIIPSRGGDRMTPSVVGLDRQEKLHVGKSAKNQLVAMPERTVAEVKRSMGSPEQVRLGDRNYSPIEISALILRSLKEDAEHFFDGSVEEAVITVPAYFTDAQRKATKDAGELAGFRVDRIINEPTAAALAYGIDHLDEEQFVLVYDLGGGTFDVSVLEMFGGVLDVKASAGNNRLGGSDFDRAVVTFLREEFERRHGVDLRGNLQAMARLKAAAEQAKVELSSLESTTVVLPFLASRGGEALSLELELDRARFERLIGDLVRSTIEPIEAALLDGKVDRRAISDVVMVGGSSRVPMVERLVTDYFGKQPRRGVNPDEAVVLGAAVQAGLVAGAISNERGIMITDVCPFTLGVEVMTSAGRQKLGGMFSAILPRNSTVPVSRTEIYATTVDGQRQVDIKIFQGESKLVKNNVYLDQYCVDGVPPGPAGSERVAVTFTYDINGILEVKTKIVSTGKEATLIVDESPQRMSDGDRARAKQRLDREWGGARPPSPSAEKKTAEAPGPSPVGEAPSAAVAPDDLAPLLAAARAKLKVATGDAASRLRSLLEQVERASSEGDRASLSRLDVELTDLLFELD